MEIRTTETTVTFNRPFMLAPIDSPLPAGTYRILTEEEEILGLTFLAFRRSATMLQVPAVSVSSSRGQLILVDFTELQAALEADG